MRDRAAATKTGAPSSSSKNLCAEIARIAPRDLRPIVRDIDAGFYPEAVLRALGAAGAFAGHVPDRGGSDLMAPIEAMAVVAEYCLSSAFCMWCQDALAWYIHVSENRALKPLGHRAARGEVLGGTGLSNPMKAFCKIETMRLKARRVPGGYQVTGALPWVSNLGPDHYFAVVFEVEGAVRHYVMAVVSCSSPALSLIASIKLVALDGTRTFAVQFRDVFVADENVLADPIEPYLARIRCGFVLLQAGMAIGLIRDCIDLMRRTSRSLGHVNRYIDVQPEDVEARLHALEAAVARLAATPLESDPAHWREVIEARLAASETSIAAAHAAMLHCGARGYVMTGAAQRRLREAYFTAIATPSTKQLKKMVADMAS